MPTNNPLIFELVHALASALSHRIRSPLSAISNEVFCLKAKAPEPEHDRMRDRCQEIAALLSQSCALGHEPLQLSVFSLRQLLSEVFGEAAARVAENAFVLGDFISGDRGRLRTALEGIRAAFNTVGGVKESESSLGIRVDVAPASKKFALTISFPAVIADDLRDQPPAATLTRFFNAQLGLDLLGTILADAVLFAHDVPIYVDAKNGLRVSFELPRSVE